MDVEGASAGERLVRADAVEELPVALYLEAEIVANPALEAVMRPLPSTLAIAVSDDLQLKVAGTIVPSIFAAIALIRAVSPGFRATDAGLKTMLTPSGPTTASPGVLPEQAPARINPNQIIMLDGMNLWSRRDCPGRL